MVLAHEHRRQLSRMEEERRQTQRQLDRIERQITRRMTALIPTLLPKKTHYRRGQAPTRARSSSAIVLSLRL